MLRSAVCTDIPLPLNAMRSRSILAAVRSVGVARLTETMLGHARGDRRVFRVPPRRSGASVLESALGKVTVGCTFGESRPGLSGAVDALTCTIA